MRLFLERGFDQVSVAEVSRAADVSEATVFNYFPTKEDLVYERMDAFEQELLAAVRDRPEGEPALRAFARFILDRSDSAATGEGRRRVAALTRLTTASPSLQARERQIVASYTEALAALLAEETGAAADDIEPRLGAETMMAFHRSLIDFARRRALSRKSSSEFASEIRAAGEHALTLLEGGPPCTAGAPHRIPLATILTRREMLFRQCVARRSRHRRSPASRREGER